MGVDWNLVREDYFARNLRGQGTVRSTLKELADAWAIPYKTVRNRASGEKWSEQFRDRAIQHATAVATRLQREDVVDETVVRLRHAKTARLAIDTALARLASVDPEELTVREMVELLRLGLTEERRALGLPEQFEISGAAARSATVVTVEERKDRHRKLATLGTSLLTYIEQQGQADEPGE